MRIAAPVGMQTHETLSNKQSICWLGSSHGETVNKVVFANTLHGSTCSPSTITTQLQLTMDKFNLDKGSRPALYIVASASTTTPVPTISTPKALACCRCVMQHSFLISMLVSLRLLRSCIALHYLSQLQQG